MQVIEDDLASNISDVTDLGCWEEELDDLDNNYHNGINYNRINEFFKFLSQVNSEYIDSYGGFNNNILNEDDIFIDDVNSINSSDSTVVFKMELTDDCNFLQKFRNVLQFF